MVLVSSPWSLCLGLLFPKWLTSSFFSSVLSLSFSSIASYRYMLSGVFRFVLPELSLHFVLHDLLLSFRQNVLCRLLVSLLGIF